jgi:hypothetical protein
MSSIKVHWKASEKLQHEEYVATGDKPTGNHQVKIDLVELTPAQRTTLITAAHIREPFDTINLQKAQFDPEYARGWGRYYYRATELKLDKEPNLFAILGLCGAMTKAADAASEYTKKVKAEKNKVAAEEKAEIARLTAAYDEALPKIQALIDAGNLETLKKGIGISGKLNFFTPAYKSSLYKIADEAQRDIVKQQREDAKETWIVENASAHLRRAFDDGYNCQRLYVQERAEQEASAFTVDFNDKATWKERSCPSAGAMDLADEVAELGNAKVVWLTAPAQDHVPDDDYWDEPFEEREAVIVRSYLGKYDLVSN